MMEPKRIRAAEIAKRIEAKLDSRPTLMMGISLLAMVPILIVTVIAINHPLAAGLLAAAFGGPTLVVCGVRSNRADRVERREAEERFTQHVEAELSDNNLAWTVWSWARGMGR